MMLKIIEHTEPNFILHLIIEHTEPSFILHNILDQTLFFITSLNIQNQTVFFCFSYFMLVVKMHKNDIFVVSEMVKEKV